MTVLSGGTTPEPPIALAKRLRHRGGRLQRRLPPDLAVTSASTAAASRHFLNTTLGAAAAPGATPTADAYADADAATLPEPVAVAGRNVNATPVGARCRVKLPGSKDYVDLSQAQQLPVGTTVDTRKGTVELVAAGGGGTAKFFDGIFRISQTRGSRPLTTLTLTEQLSCPKAHGRLVRGEKKTASCGATARARSGRPGATAPRRCAARSGS